jgi:hypothetical protein
VLDPAMARFVMDQMEALPMKCTPMTVADQPAQVTVVVPFAWTQPAPPPKK